MRHAAVTFGEYKSITEANISGLREAGNLVNIAVIQPALGGLAPPPCSAENPFRVMRSRSPAASSVPWLHRAGSVWPVAAPVFLASVFTLDRDAVFIRADDFGRSPRVQPERFARTGRHHLRGNWRSRRAALS